MKKKKKKKKFLPKVCPPKFNKSEDMFLTIIKTGSEQCGFTNEEWGRGFLCWGVASTGHTAMPLDTKGGPYTPGALEGRKKT